VTNAELDENLNAPIYLFGLKVFMGDLSGADLRSDPMTRSLSILSEHPVGRTCSPKHGLSVPNIGADSWGETGPHRYF
jgi:hypothetical protein